MIRISIKLDQFQLKVKNISLGLCPFQGGSQGADYEGDTAGVSSRNKLHKEAKTDRRGIIDGKSFVHYKIPFLSDGMWGKAGEIYSLSVFEWPRNRSNF
jgi:hypothetical protein